MQKKKIYIYIYVEIVRCKGPCFTCKISMITLTCFSCLEGFYLSFLHLGFLLVHVFACFLRSCWLGRDNGSLFFWSFFLVPAFLPEKGKLDWKVRALPDM